MSDLREQLLRFITSLRAAAVPVSIAESLDAMEAVAAAGLERARMREALAAALVKDQADRPAFDQVFARFFGGHAAAESAPRPDSRSGTAGERGPGQSSSDRPDAHPHAMDSATGARQESRDAATQSLRVQKEDPIQSEDRSAGEAQSATPGEPSGDEWGILQAERFRAIERTPFERYSQTEYETARDALAPLKRRFKVRLGRRLKRARRGRVDFRRTLRAAIQHGGALADLRFRSRRPRHMDLVILADISGSVRYSSALMLEIVAGAHSLFRRVNAFVFIDRLAEADFEQGHLVMTPALDLYARSDFGRALAELWARHAELLGRGTVVVIMGDGRNNRRPARADLLREMGRHCLAVLWLNPEAPERWGTGDSAIPLYAREATALIAAGSLRELEQGLVRIA